MVGGAGAGARQAPAARRRGARSAPRRDRRRDHPRGRHAEAAVGGDPGRHRHLRVHDRVGARHRPSRSRTRRNGLVVREPIGVVGCITPWNYPLNQIGAKVAYALAAGCTVVLKPSEVAPVNAFILAEIIDEIGFPAGVFNLVTGLGPVVGEALAAHPDVDMVSFTGSTRAGKRGVRARGTVDQEAWRSSSAASRRTSSSTTPTSPTAVAAGVGAAYANSGQTCSALTRMIVPRSRLAEVEQIATRRRGVVHRRRSVRGRHAARAADLVGAARARARLHREGHRRGRRCSSPAGADAARRPRHRLLREADGVLERDHAT